MSTGERALFRLMSWLSPSFPVGSYTYSHGLEAAVEDGLVVDGDTLAAWIEDLLVAGSPRNDAIFLTAGWQAACAEDEMRFAEVRELAAVCHATAELKLESLQQGGAFRDAVRRSWPAPGIERLCEDAPLAYPVAVGVTAAAHGVPLRSALHAYLHAFAANLVSAGVRLIPLGQNAGQRALAALEPPVHALAEAAETATLDDLGGCAWLAEIGSMRHETQYTRLFRS
ncbi:MAG: urease accessory protein UreF [Alphaproteobacteria bacterium]|jgi:urease accessory protein|nr:urease accessory protein UreF [Alphaproteobacteria bacterium]